MSDVSTTSMEATKETGTQAARNRRSLISRLLRHGSGGFGLVVIGLIIVLVSLAPFLAPYAPDEMDLSAQFQPPGTPGHFLGTDAFGRDILSRLLWGGRISLPMSAMATLIAMGTGVPIGLAVGYYGGWADNLVMRLVDILLAFPYLLLAIVIIGALGPGLINAMLAVAVSGIPFYVRLTRGLVLSLRSHTHVEAAVALGAPSARVMARHILPLMYPYLIVQVTLNAGYTILAVSGLSFVGLGAQPPSPEWGAMLADSRQYMTMAPHTVLMPGGAILLVALALNLVGDGLRDVLDVTLDDQA